MQEIFECSREYGYRHYFYGSTPETLKLLEEKLGETYGLDIAGLESPPFRALTPEEDEAAVERINASGADFVWIGLGAPKQERWMAAHEGLSLIHIYRICKKATYVFNMFYGKLAQYQRKDDYEKIVTYMGRCV